MSLSLVSSSITRILQIFYNAYTYKIILFFFHWHYSPLWALAYRTMSFHFFPTCHQLPVFSLPALEDLFLLPLSIFSWVFSFFSFLPVLEWRSFWAFYPPPFTLDNLSRLFFALLSILLYYKIITPKLNKWSVAATRTYCPHLIKIKLIFN